MCVCLTEVDERAAFRYKHCLLMSVNTVANLSSQLPETVPVFVRGEPNVFDPDISEIPKSPA
jgi:hypothetical protein